MFNIFRTLLGALIMTAMILPHTAEASELSLTRLKNGFTLLIQEDERFPLVSSRIYIHAGSAYETPKQAGISHLLEHMVFKGTKNRAPGEVAAAIEGVGGAMNAATSFDYTVYYVNMPAEHWALGLDVLKDITFNASIDPDELEREKKVVLSELERGEDSPDSLLFKRMQGKIWPETPYSLPIIGFRDTVTSISPQDIHDYIAHYYQPQSMLLVVCGNVKKDDVIKEVEQLFGDLENTRQVQQPQPYPTEQLLAAVDGGPKLSIARGKWNEAYVSIALPIPGFRSAEIPGIDVLAHLLGGDHTSKLYRKLKYEMQLVNSISMSALTLERVGMLYIRAHLAPEKLDAFWETLMQELRDLKAEDFSADEIERAKLNIEDSLYQTKETISGLASKLGYFQFFEHDVGAEEAYIFDVRTVDANVLDEMIASYLHPERMRSILLLPERFISTEQIQEKEQALAAETLKVWPAKSTHDEPKSLAKAGEHEIIDLGHGRTLVLLPDNTLPYTAIQMTYRGGDALLSESEEGLAELTAKTITKGANGRSATELQDFLADNAADLYSSSGRDMFSIHAKFPTRFSEQVLEVLRDVLTAPAFASEEVAREKKNQIAAIKRREDQPLGLAFRNIFPFLFTGAPYGFFHLGAPAQVEKYTEAQVKEFWLRQRTRPWTMAVCGDFNKQRILSLANELQASLEREGAKAPAFIAPVWAESRTKALHLADRNQAHLIQIFRVPGLEHPDTPGLNLLRAILSGQSGLLFSELRDKQGLGYTVTAFLWQSPKTGFMAFYIGTSPEKIDQSLAGFKDVIDRLLTAPINAEDIQRGKNSLVGDYYQDHQSLSSRSREAAILLSQELPLANNRNTLEKASKLTAEELTTLAKKYLVLENAYLLKVVP